MVSQKAQDLVSFFARGDLHPFLGVTASTANELAKGAKHDIDTGIIAVKDFDNELQTDPELLKKFKDSYVSVLRSVRVSSRAITNTIFKTVGNLEVYRPVMGMRERAVTTTMGIVQSVEVGNAETNNAYYILKNNLSDIQWQLKTRAHKDKLSPSLEALKALSDKLETGRGRELLRELYLLEVPKLNDLSSYHERTYDKPPEELPQLAVMQGLPDSGKDNWANYCRNWIMVIDSHMKALEGAAALYELGGELAELDVEGTFRASESLDRFEREIRGSHDAIKNQLIVVFRQLSARAMSKSADFPDESKAWKAVADRLDNPNTDIKAKVKTSPSRRQFNLHQGLQMSVIKTIVLRAFDEIDIPDHPHFK